MKPNDIPNNEQLKESVKKASSYVEENKRVISEGLKSKWEAPKIMANHCQEQNDFIIPLLALASAKIEGRIGELASEKEIRNIIIDNALKVSKTNKDHLVISLIKTAKSLFGKVPSTISKKEKLIEIIENHIPKHHMCVCTCRENEVENRCLQIRNFVLKCFRDNNIYDDILKEMKNV
jgi:hypothetical protein